MDTHILKEKIDRSRRLLTRLQDEFSQDINGLLQLMEKSNQYLDTLAKVQENLMSKITETQVNLETLTAQHQTLLSTKNKLIEQLNQVSQELKSCNQTLEAKSDEQTQINQLITTIQAEIELLTSTRQQHTQELVTIKQDIINRGAELKIDLQTKEKEKITLEQQIQEAKNKHKAITFLLEESAEDIPEVSILSVIMRLKHVRTDELKELLRHEILPVMINRTLGRMLEKQLIQFNESENRYSMP